MLILVSCFKLGLKHDSEVREKYIFMLLCDNNLIL